MSHVPSELYRDILIWLPAEPLLRFRCVSKEWKRIIDDPDFRKLHLDRQMGVEDMLMIRSPKGKFYSLSMELLNHPKSRICKIEAVHRSRHAICQWECEYPVPSCHGLILIRRRENPWVVWNPFLGDRLELSLPLDVYKVERFGRFDGGGLGYDSSTNDYKVVRICARLTLLKNPLTLIYSVKSNQWHMIQSFPGLSAQHDGIFFDGALHWYCQTINEKAGGLMRCLIALDLSTESYHNVPLPASIVDDAYRHVQFHASEGCLLMSCYSPKGSESIWILNACGNDKIWTTLISFIESPRGPYFPSVIYMRYKQLLLLGQRTGTFLLLDLRKKVGKNVLLDLGKKVRKNSTELVRETFSFQVFPASLIRLPRNANEASAAGNRACKRKRKTDGNDSFSLKLRGWTVPGPGTH